MVSLLPQWAGQWPSEGNSQTREWLFPFSYLKPIDNHFFLFSLFTHLPLSVLTFEDFPKRARLPFFFSTSSPFLLLIFPLSSSHCLTFFLPASSLLLIYHPPSTPLHPLLCPFICCRRSEREGLLWRLREKLLWQRYGSSGLCECVCAIIESERKKIYIYYKLSYSINIGLNFCVALLYVLYIKCLVQNERPECVMYTSVSLYW